MPYKDKEKPERTIAYETEKSTEKSQTEDGKENRIEKTPQNRAVI